MEGAVLMTPTICPAERNPDSSEDPLAISPAGYAFLQDLVYRESGIVLAGDRHALLQLRLEPVMRRLDLPTLKVLCDRLMERPDPCLRRQVVEAMTTNETYFFRDTPFFAALRKEVLPMLLPRVKASRPLRVWSAAASTGQEAYSVAMLLLDAGLRPGQVELVATDLSEQVVARGRLGLYSPMEVLRGLPPGVLARYFVRNGTAWQIRRELRAMVDFRQMDLRSSLAEAPAFDLILCRNVLIYFDESTRTGVLQTLAAGLAVHGLLALGSAESVPLPCKALERSPIAGYTFYRQNQRQPQTQAVSVR